MTLKKLLTLALAGVMALSMTACLPLDAAEVVYDAVFGGGSSGSGSTSAAAGMNETEKAIAEVVAQRLTDPEYGVATVEDIPETKQLAALFQQSWMPTNGNELNIEPSVGKAMVSILSNLSKKYDPSTYAVEIDIIKVEEYDTIQSEGERFTGTGGRPFYYCVVEQPEGADKVTSIDVCVTTITSGDTTYRFLLQVME